MDIKSKINFFNASNGKDFIISRLSAPCEVKFPPRSLKQRICFGDFNLCIDLINYKREEQREFKLTKSSLISLNYLSKLSNQFQFRIEGHPLDKNHLIGVLPNLNDEYGKICFGAIKKYDDQYFFIIYSKKGSTHFEDDTIYIFGLWEVFLSAEMSVNLFGQR